MKAAYRSGYGSPEVLSIVDTDIPVPKENEILIKVFAATVNRTDCAVLSGMPFIMRFFTGLNRPKIPATGTDFAGIVESAGKGVKKFRTGDKVWGFYDNGLGSHSQYFTLPEDKPVAVIPRNLTFAEAAASAEGAHYAINFLNKVNLKPNQKVMVNGASGAIGSAAVQFLKASGMYVTAVCGTENLELIKSLGADRVIDYMKEDFTKDSEKYDFVFDTVGKSTFAKCKPLLNPGGVYISSELGPKAQNPFLALVTPLLGDKKVIFPFPSDIPGSLAFIKEQVEAGKFRPVIDRKYPLEKIRDAFEYTASGKKTGNVVLILNEK